jgi:hypothetical protein
VSHSLSAVPRKSGDKMDLAVVVNDKDMMQLMLLIRSIKLYFSETSIGQLFIIVNEYDPDAAIREIKALIVPELGSLVKLTEVIPATRLMRPHIAVPGLITQQAFKLLINKYVGTDAYLVLDPKLHFVRSVNFSSFVDSKAGKLRSYRQKPAPDLLNGNVARAFDYFDLTNPHDFILPLASPFPIYRDAVRTMISFMEDKEGFFFDDILFRREKYLDPLHLYFAYLVKEKGNIENIYRFGPRSVMGILNKWPSKPEDIRKVLASLAENQVSSFSINLSRYGGFDADLRSEIAQLWADRGLMPSADDGLDYIRNLADVKVGAV